MDVLEFVQSHKCCAINMIPRDVWEEWRVNYPELDLPLRSGGHMNARFVEGKWVSCFSPGYELEQHWTGGTIEAVMNGDELHYSNTSDDVDFNDVGLLQLL